MVLYEVEISGTPITILYIYTHFLSLFSTWNQNLRHLFLLTNNNELGVPGAVSLLWDIVSFFFFFCAEGGGDEGVSLDYMIYVLRCRLEGRGDTISFTNFSCVSVI